MTIFWELTGYLGLLVLAQSVGAWAGARLADWRWNRQYSRLDDDSKIDAHLAFTEPPL